MECDPAVRKLKNLFYIEMTASYAKYIKPKKKKKAECDQQYHTFLLLS